MAIVPSGSFEAEASKLAVALGETGLGVAVNEALGGRFWTVSVRVAVAVAPLLSVTRSPTVRVPGFGVGDVVVDFP